jgi:hypothetical protein
MSSESRRCVCFLSILFTCPQIFALAFPVDYAKSSATAVIGSISIGFEVKFLSSSFPYARCHVIDRTGLYEFFGLGWPLEFWWVLAAPSRWSSEQIPSIFCSVSTTPQSGRHTTPLNYRIGRRSLSALGIVHIFQRRRFIRSWNEDFSALYTEGGQLGPRSAGIVAFLRRRLVNLDDEDLETLFGRLSLCSHFVRPSTGFPKKYILTLPES